MRGGREFVDALAAGDEVNVPNGTLDFLLLNKRGDEQGRPYISFDPGLYYLGAMIDEWDAIPESDETNNTNSTPIRVVEDPRECGEQQPEPPIDSLELTVDISHEREGFIICAVVGQDLAPLVTVTVSNIGTADAGGFNMGFYLSFDTDISREDLLLSGGRRFVDGLAAGESIILPLNALNLIALDTNGVDVTEARRYILGVIIDDLDAVAELNEDNNTDWLALKAFEDPRECEPDQEMGVAEALDEDNDGIINDAEIMQAMRYWISGEAVPGTDQTIDDEMMNAKMRRLKWGAFGNCHTK